MQQHLTKSDRLLAYKLEDTWQKGRTRITPNQTKDEAFITASRQFLIVNTPLKDLMFRHTRDTLRQYYIQFENTGEDTKCAQFLTQLRQELNTRDSAIVFTQYTDTMDYLREFLRSSFGNQLACYSGRGGELYRDNQWTTVPKEDIKQRFRKGEIKILLCTESASEGLNLQTCGVLINYDTPWNPMRVEQRIGIDRIGQCYPTVRIHNFYYDGTVEAKVYRKLRDRIDAFPTVVGKLQPILAKVPTFIERALNSADPQEEDVRRHCL